jgi:lipopolysaccharide/colanic/teichoic acid biosynthesis glycosyltransferase/acetyltransferase-like isoleucine patch superfamily enzyme
MRIRLYYDQQAELLSHIFRSKSGGTLFFHSLEKQAFMESFGQSLHLLPDQWVQANPELADLRTHTYSSSQWMIPDLYKKNHSESTLLINGCYAFKFDENQITNLFRDISADVVFLKVTENLSAGNEAIRLTPNDEIVGFRRFYQSEVEPMPLPEKWPHIVYLKEGAWKKFSSSGKVPLLFDEFVKKVRDFSLEISCLKIGGKVLEFCSEQGVVSHLDQSLDTIVETNGSAYPDVRMVGPVSIGRDVKIGAGSLLIGPVVISDHVEIGAGATVRCSFLSEQSVVADSQTINRRVFVRGFETQQTKKPTLTCPESDFFDMKSQPDFKGWPFFSYARLGKRIFDILFATAILILLIPILLVVSVLVKLTSPGPIFYKARRQGHHGNEFGCLKFRTMIVQADAMQERLRVVNQVDGPQFKIDHDPRISGLGKFLRDTCIDELPQFFNVLFGQMSVVGPRPSPASENESSPAWRDARLSVRPGITGLWQISRTRQASMDFQEWVHYDTEYVRNLSFRRDIWICFKTAQMLISTFLNQFG